MFDLQPTEKLLSFSPSCDPAVGFDVIEKFSNTSLQSSQFRQLLQSSMAQNFNQSLQSSMAQKFNELLHLSMAQNLDLKWKSSIIHFCLDAGKFLSVKNWHKNVKSHALYLTYFRLFSSTSAAEHSNNQSQSQNIPSHPNLGVSSVWILQVWAQTWTFCLQL